MSKTPLKQEIAGEALIGNQGPRVRLIEATGTPFDLSIASARTCYSGNGIVLPGQVSADAEATALRDRIARSTLKAGHLTTRQHPHFVFALEGVSRHLVWSFLHSHPYYNSEQVSQRYVAVRAEQFHIPSSLEQEGRDSARAIYQEAMRYSVGAYNELIYMLVPEVSREYFRLFPKRAARPELWRRGIQKKAMEAARYILPVATHTYLYHTINGLTLHRYRRLCRSFDVPEETHLLVERMVEEVNRVDPLFVAEMADPLPLEETLEYAFFDDFYGRSETGDLNWNREGARRFVNEFDDLLEGRPSRLVSADDSAVAVLAATIRAVLGLPSDSYGDADALELVLNPARNKHLQATLNESSVSKLTRSLANVHYVFQKKISHTADSQDQRHRMVPGARPVLWSHYAGRPDYIVPAIIGASSRVSERYRELMVRLFTLIEDFLQAGGSSEEAVYMLPNAFPVRFYESGDLLNLHHKWKARLCYNAQEEIFHASVAELLQIGERHPEIARFIGAPCRLRREAGVTPYCPEGDRYCGTAVWDREPTEFRRLL